MPAIHWLRPVGCDQLVVINGFNSRKRLRNQKFVNSEFDSFQRLQYTLLHSITYNQPFVTSWLQSVACNQLLQKQLNWKICLFSRRDSRNSKTLFLWKIIPIQNFVFINAKIQIGPILSFFEILVHVINLKIRCKCFDFVFLN